jgi:vacuolar-type H+-ATPase subunit I/STV1
VEPLNSNRHKYLAKRTSVFPAINLGRMNSMMRVVKSKVLQHFENDLDPTNLSIMMDKQLENLNTRLETYKKEYQTLKEREERELSGYNLEIQIKKADFDIKEQIAKNQELKRSN